MNVTLRKSGTKLEHQGIKIEFVGQIELYYDRGNHHEFTSLVKVLFILQDRTHVSLPSVCNLHCKIFPTNGHMNRNSFKIVVYYRRLETHTPFRFNPYWSSNTLIRNSPAQGSLLKARVTTSSLSMLKSLTSLIQALMSDYGMLEKETWNLLEYSEFTLNAACFWNEHITKCH